MNEILKIENLTKLYKMGEHLIRAVDDVSFEIEEGEFVSVVGPSGSGKTTLLNLLGCIDKPTEGKIFLENKNLSEMKENDLEDIRLKKIGFVFQSFNLLPTLTAIENVELPLGLNNYGKIERRKKAEEFLNLVGLKERFNHRPFQLSAGEHQRVGIARALSNNPAIILADEPTGNLDSKTALSIMDLLLKINKERKCTIIMVTHNLEIVKFVPKIIKMKDGKILEEKEEKC